MTHVLNENSTRSAFVAGMAGRALPPGVVEFDALPSLTQQQLSRAAFLKAGGALVVGFSLAGSLVKAGGAKGATKTALAGPPDPSSIDSWVAIHADNTATILHGKVELGQGAPTGLLQIAAEELDLSMDQIRAHRVDTDITPDQGTTAASSSISVGGLLVRQAAAEARLALLTLASQELGVPVSQLTVDKGVVSGAGKTVTYGELVGDKLFSAKFTGKAPLKPVSEYKVVGKRFPRMDIPAKVSGKHTYVQNIRVPGMLHGRIVRPRGQGEYGKGAKPLSVDESSITGIKDVQIVRKGDLIGVVAKREYDAIQAAAQLKVEWEESATLPGHANIASAFRASKTVDRVVVNTGNVEADLARADKTVSQSYVAPFQSHGMIGPSAAVVDYQAGGTTTVFSQTQSPYPLRNRVASSLGLKNEQVRLIRFEGSGCYGHSAYDDCAIAAAIMSQAVGKPVRLQFMRWDEHGWDQYGPAALVDIRAGIDAAGKITAFDYASWQPGWMSVETSQELALATPLPLAVGNPDQPNSAGQYAIPSRRVTGKSIPNVNGGVLKAVWLRAPGAPQALFAAEQAIDELAFAAGMDPIAFRKLNITDERWIGVIDAAVKAANWRPRRAATNVSSGNVVKGRGIAIGGFANTYTAVIADIELNRKTGKIVAKHLYAAQDAGLAINPALLEQQMEGCLVQGTSRALLEEVRFSETRVTSLDWVTYPILRYKDSPEVTTIVVNRPDQRSSGAGEPTTAPVPAAIANAFFDATGVRIRAYPMTPARVRTTLAAAKNSS
jgi:nicotinate dehydrogenase subunit B